MLSFFKNNWPTITIGIILAIIIGLNSHPGKLILGNDNFSPELDPELTISRSFSNPAWRDSRILGIPSDSEQADVWRTIIYWLGSRILPPWIISQGYIFLTLIIGVISMGKAARLLTGNYRTSEFFGSLLYLFSPITVWVYFYPVHLFVAAYAFTPLVLWFSLRTVQSPTRSNKLLLLASSLLMGTTALTATMFITVSLTVFALTFFYSLPTRQFKTWLITIIIYLLTHLFWILPFSTYVKSNSSDLQNSAINREITTSTIASEQSNNTWSNNVRFSSAWIDSKEDDQNYTYEARHWFRENTLSKNLGYTLSILATLGLLISLFRPRNHFTQILTGILGLFGLILMGGYNPPFSQIYSLFDQYIPLFHQVFRWSSSKFWPLLLYPLIILATLTLSQLIKFAKFRLLKIVLILGFTTLIIYTVHPIFSYRLIREDVFVTIPNVYTNLKQNLPDKTTAIDTTPHTNTRYFRKYDWGFWGSVFHNYLLPNPTTEKALVIGSEENQIAFETIEQSYNSHDQKTYSSALARYNIAQVLSDQSATNKGLGLSYAHPFDWELHKQMVADNSNLTSTWYQDYLHLYRLNNSLSTQSIPLSPQHNLAILSKTLSTTHNNNSYHLKDAGAIYPLALQTSNIYQDDSSINLETTITSTGEYQINIPSATLENLPLIASRSSTSLALTPYHPTVTHNKTLVYNLPTSTTNISESPITINNQIIRETPTILEPNIPLKIESWGNSNSIELDPLEPTLCNPDKTNPSNQKCYRTELDTSSDSLLSFSADLSANEPTLLDICLHSHITNSCLNSPKTYHISSESDSVTVDSNNKVSSGDNIVVFLVAKTTDSNTTPNIFVERPTLTQFTRPQNIPFKPYRATDIQATLPLNAGDTLTTQLPITTLIPPFQIFHSNCPDRGDQNMIKQDQNSTAFTTTNCFDGLFSSFSLPNHLNSTALLTHVSAKHDRGIPFEYNLKQDKVARKVVSDLLPSNGGSDFLNFALLPTANQNFTIEIVNKGIGNLSTTNSLNSFTSIPIPRSWLSLSLTPINSTPQTIITLQPYSSSRSTGTYLTGITDIQGLYTLPTATSPYWRATILSTKPKNLLSLYFQVLVEPSIHDKTLVNGWQDAWNVSSQDQDKFITVIYFPNVLAYLGLFIGLGTAFVLVAVKRATKTASTHTFE